MIIGSSRTKQGIDPVEFSKTLDDKDIVVNLARSWRGNGNIYHLIREFLENHNIKKKIIIEYSNMDYKKRIGKKNSYNNGYYPNYNLVTESSYLIDDFFYTPRDPFFLKIRDLIFRYIDLIDKRIDYLFKNKGKIFFQSNDKKNEILSNTTCFTADNKIKTDELNKIKKEKKDIFKENKSHWDISYINYDRHNIYIDKIKKLAKNKGIDVVLFNVPRIYDPMLSPETVYDIEKRFGLTFIYPDEPFIDKLYKIENYTDPTHMNIKGRLIYSKWLAMQVINK